MMKSKIIFLPAIIILFSSMLTSCYYDSKEYLFPAIGNTCDTSNITYLATVVPVLDNSCTGCHNSSLASGNINLDNYADVKTQADNGKLMGSVTHSSGFSPMPKGSSKLNDCSITILQNWVDSGAPNN